MDAYLKKLTSSYFEIEISIKSTRQILESEIPNISKPSLAIEYIAFNGSD